MRRRAVAALSWVLILGAFAAWAVLLRPVALGGDATYVIVRGDSMLRDYQAGDLVIARRDSSYSVGDVVAYRVPIGEVEDGQVVLHRLVGERNGGFVMQGDNNPTPDPWAADADHILGRAWFALPGAGRGIAFVARPVVAAALAMAVVVAFVLLRPAPGDRLRSTSARS